MAREFPAAFDRQLHRLFPDYVGGRFNEQLGRWELVFASASGRPVSQFWGWDHNPLTGAAIKPDPVTGLYPFRDLDATAQHEIIANCQKTFVGNTDGATGDIRHDRLAEMAAARQYNANLRASRRRQQATDFADMVSEFDIRRPGWLKEHSREGKLLTRKSSLIS